MAETLLMSGGRRVGKSAWHRAMFDAFMNTPGASTDDPASMKEIERKATLNILKKRGEYDPPIAQLRKTHMTIENEELDDATEIEADLADLAADLTSSWVGLNPDEPANSVTLLSQEMLTVEIEGRGFRKIAHMGGESFVPQSAYLGKKRKLIVVFKPIGAAEYTTMEMAVGDAIENLAGFDQLTGGADEDGYRARIKKISAKAAKLADKKAAEAKGADYGESYGSF